MSGLQIGDIFEYHQFSDSYLAFVAKDERIALFKPATKYSDYYLKYCAPLTESSYADLINSAPIKKLQLDSMTDDFKACYTQEFSPLKKGSKVDFNYRGTVISGVVVERNKSYKKIKAKFIVNSATLYVSAEPYLFTEKP